MEKGKLKKKSLQAERQEYWARRGITKFPQAERKKQEQEKRTPGLTNLVPGGNRPKLQ